jgi:tRNA A37 methylthiotransferase MiaB
MNTNDTEIVWAVLRSAGYSKTDDVSGADAVLVMTCAIREGAEAKIWNRLDEFRAMKRARRRKDKAQAQGPLAVGVLGMRTPPPPGGARG